MEPYSIGITTYQHRFDKWLKPLIRSIKKFRPDIEIHIAVNGEYKQQFDEEYRRNILKFASDNSNTFIFMFPEFRSLSKLWNNLLINSTTHKVLLLNDDVSIVDSCFFDALETVDLPMFKINRSWSHVLLDRRVVDEIGWFDERLLAIGEEDGDFEWRYGNKTQGRSVPSVMLPGIINHTDSENCLKNMSIVNKKYAKFNNYFTYEVKYKIDDLKGVQHGIMPVKVECISPTPTLHCTEKFYWDNIDRL